ncbi:MAG: hypothetical protein ACUVXI_16890 [bacterium]
MSDRSQNAEDRPIAIIDLKVLFTALREPNSDSDFLFQRADEGELEIWIPSCVYEELQEIFARRGLDLSLMDRFIGNCQNVKLISDARERDGEEDIGRSAVADPRERPTFDFAYRNLKEKSNAYLVALADSLLTERAKETLWNRVRRVREFLDETMTGRVRDG